VSVRPPCPSCPWRVDQDATVIPGFALDLAENLEATTRRDFGAPIFGCHLSREGAEFACAGWLAVYGTHSIAVRLMLISGQITPEALQPGEDWPELHESFEEVIVKLRATAGGSLP
jgi:hypothetical protein